LFTGPALAGVVIGALGAARALCLDAGSYLVSVATLVAIRHREQAPVAVSRAPLWREVGAGLRFVAARPLLRAIAIVAAVYNLGVAMYESMLVLFAVRQLHLSPWLLGLAVGVGGVGFPVGSLLARRLAARYGIGPALVIAGVPSVLGLAVAACAYGRFAVPLLAAGTLLNGLGQGAFAVNAVTVRHLATPPAMATRATAVIRFVSWGMLPVGSALAGVIGTAAGLRATMLIAAGIAATCLVPLLGRAVRTTRDLHRAAA